MRGEDFLFEAVRNSYEAGAGHVEVSIELVDGVAKASVLDDGHFECTDDCFREGVSTKGEGRGKGLYLLKCTCPDARIEHGPGWTLLSYSFPYDGSGLITVVPFLLSDGIDCFKWQGELFERCVLEKLYGDASTSGFIAGVKQHLRAHGIR